MIHPDVPDDKIQFSMLQIKGLHSQSRDKSMTLRIDLSVELPGVPKVKVSMPGFPAVGGANNSVAKVFHLPFKRSRALAKTFQRRGI